MNFGSTQIIKKISHQLINSKLRTTAAGYWLTLIAQLLQITQMETGDDYMENTNQWNILYSFFNKTATKVNNNVK
jgi:hypothetical protein